MLREHELCGVGMDGYRVLAFVYDTHGALVSHCARAIMEQSEL